MIYKIILLCVLIGIRLGYTNLVEPIIKNEIYITQMTNDVSGYVLINAMPYVENVMFGIYFILIFLIGMDIYKHFNNNKKGE